MATYTLRGRVTDDHRLEVELPEDAPAGAAEVTVTVRERGSREAYPAVLESWKRNPLSGPRRTREEIDADLRSMRDVGIATE
jgi:hypothetical protein